MGWREKRDELNKRLSSYTSNEEAWALVTKPENILLFLHDRLKLENPVPIYQFDLFNEALKKADVAAWALFLDKVYRDPTSSTETLKQPPASTCSKGHPMLFSASFCARCYMGK